MQIFAVNIKKHLNEESFNLMFSLVSQDKRKKAKRYLKKEDKYRTVTGEFLIRKIISEKLSIENKEIEFSQNKHGKPFLLNHKNVHFNISHSGDWVVCVVDDNPVGIDIEKIDNINLDIAKRFFSEEEYMDLMSKNKKDRTDYFYDLWTLKESYIKLIGRGLSIPLDSFTIKKYNNTKIKIKPGLNKNECYFRMYNIAANYKLSVSSCKNIFPEGVICLEKEDFF